MNLSRNSNNKKRVVSTLFLYLFLLLLGCDFRSPEEWETPGWYTNLTLPLINTEYSFGEILSDTMFYNDTLNVALPSDTVSEVIHVTYPVPVPAQSIPDSIFDIDMSSDKIIIPDLGLGTGDPLFVPPIPDSTINKSIPVDVLEILPEQDCYPVSSLIALDDIDAFRATIPIEFDIGIDLIEIKSVVITQGAWNTVVGNNLPFKVDVDFSIFNGDIELYSTGSSLHNIVPYEVRSDSEEITFDSPETINLNDSLVYLATFSFDQNQKGDVDCPDLLNPLGTGWEISKDSTISLNISFGYQFIKIGSINAHFKGLNKQVIMEKGIPGFQGLSIKLAKIAESTDEYPNKLYMDITNTFFNPFNLQIDFINFYDNNDSEWEYLSKTITIEPNDSIDSDKPNGQVDFSQYFMAEDSPDTENLTPLQKLVFNVYTTIDPFIRDIPVIDNYIHIGAPIFNVFEMRKMSLEYIAAITHKLEFPVSASPSLGIPDGFTDVEFMDFMMKIELFNQIAIPLDIDLNIQGTKGDEKGDSVQLSTLIGVPINDYTYENATQYADSVCVFNDIDSVRTLITTNQNFQITEFYCNPTDTEPPAWRKYLALDTIFVDENSNTLVDVLNYFPEEIAISGFAQMNGDGILLKGADIGGTFTLKSPLSLIFKKKMTIIPANPWPLTPMNDPETSEKINSSLIAGDFFVNITNKSSLGGSLSLLISDSTIFPLFLDSLITGTWEENRQHQITQWEYYFTTDPESDTNQPWIWDSLGIEIDSIAFIAIDPSDDESEALQVKFFYDDSLQFFVGRIFDLAFPAADSIDYKWGYATPTFPSFYTSSVKLDTTILSWLITDEHRNSTAMITFDKSPIGDDDQRIPWTAQTTNAIEVQAYLTLKLDTGGLIE